MRSCGVLNPTDDIEGTQEEPGRSEFVAQVTDNGGSDSGGVFTPHAREVVESIGGSLLDRPVSWPLLIVQVANLWKADKLVLSFPGPSLRLEMVGVVEKREWLESFVSVLGGGELSLLPDVLLLQKAVWSGLAHTQNAVVMVASGKTSVEPVRAVRLGLETTEWGSASLPPNSFLLQFTPVEGEAYFHKFGRALITEFEQYCCSDRTLITWGEKEISSFVPLSPRNGGIDALHQELVLGVWALARKDSLTAGIPLGRSFAKLDAAGFKRQELTFGTFRTGLLDQSAGGKDTARTVVVFTHHLEVTPSRIVWLSNGVEVGHQSFIWEPGELAVTLYLELPDDLSWDLSQQKFCWDEKLVEVLERGCEDLPTALEAMVTEYNSYAPAVGGSTVGCWILLALGALALGGVMSPLIGSKIALFLAVLLASGLMRAEIIHRHRKRYAVGQSLKQFAEFLAQSKGRRLWLEGQMFPDGTKYS